MNKNGPIIVIEDDTEDQELIEPILRTIAENDILFFRNGSEALKFLESTQLSPFIILSDINMPIVDGMEVREQLLSSRKPALKLIPYIFFTTASSREVVRQAFSGSVQGFFVKPSSIGGLEAMMKTIITYWKTCETPTLESTG